MTPLNPAPCSCGAACFCSPCLCQPAADAASPAGCACGATCACEPVCRCGQ